MSIHTPGSHLSSLNKISEWLSDKARQWSVLSLIKIISFSHSRKLVQDTRLLQCLTQGGGEGFLFKGGVCLAPDFTGLVFERQCLVFKMKGLWAKLKKNGLAGGLLCSWLADYSMQGENNRWRLITTNASSSSIGTSPPFLEQQQRCISASSPAGMAGVVSLYRLQRGSAKRFPPSEQQQ